MGSVGHSHAGRLRTVRLSHSRRGPRTVPDRECGRGEEPACDGADALYARGGVAHVGLSGDDLPGERPSRSTAIATVVLAASAAVAGVMVLCSVSVWTVLLGVMVMVALGLRARAFPLTAEVVVLLVAASVVAVRLAVLWLEYTAAAGPVAVLALLAVVPLVVLSVEPAEHVRVRLRRIGDVLESTAVIAMLPLVIGVFGVYGRLLDTFA